MSTRRKKNKKKRRRRNRRRRKTKKKKKEEEEEEEEEEQQQQQPPRQHRAHYLKRTVLTPLCLIKIPQPVSFKLQNTEVVPNPLLSVPEPNSGLHLSKMAQIGRPPPPPGLASLYTYTQPKPSAGFRNIYIYTHTQTDRQTDRQTDIHTPKYVVKCCEFLRLVKWSSTILQPGNPCLVGVDCKGVQGHLDRRWRNLPTATSTAGFAGPDAELGPMWGYCSHADNYNYYRNYRPRKNMRKMFLQNRVSVIECSRGNGNSRYPWKCPATMVAVASSK